MLSAGWAHGRSDVFLAFRRSRLQHQRAQRPQLPESIVCVDSKEYTGFDELHETLVEARKHFDHIGSEIPVTYLQLEKAVKELRASHPMMSWEELIVLAKEAILQDCNTSRDQGIVSRIKHPEDMSQWLLDGEVFERMGKGRLRRMSVEQGVCCTNIHYLHHWSRPLQ